MKKDYAKVINELESITESYKEKIDLNVKLKSDNDKQFEKIVLLENKIVPLENKIEELIKEKKEEADAYLEALSELEEKIIKNNYLTSQN